ncbi:MAG: bifunctional 4-hydroxy-2-oxoglutarate aldolase/2-dehydro-3-deoxy-phosphogluconate aldolase [Rhodobacterales bacterium]|nr:bifunctional 4-hydroxy-2-oxoglutarate aldolase/2-dehydro-3-deoxy-phosphogluconate aldolase [Rhodobacterales bacterium]
MSDVLKTLGEMGVVPVVTINEPEHAVPVAKALVAGGLPAAEITFRTAAAEEGIRLAAAAVPEALLGAGTVLNIEQARRAVAAGARFLVAPGLNPEVVRCARELGVPMLPGVCTPTDIEAAMGLGLEVLKFFPAEAMGGVKMIKALAAPYRSVKFVPTGGISPGNLADYLALPSVHACGGSWLVKGDRVAAGDFQAITDTARAAVDAVKQARA